MTKRGVLRVVSENQLAFWCNGCQEHHTVRIGEGGWSFNGDYEKPTFQPSVLVTSGHYSSRHEDGDECWCTYNIQHGDDRPGYQCIRCHSFVVDGKIQFLNDNSHYLSGKTVDMSAGF